MNEFITEQINSYHGKQYSKSMLKKINYEIMIIIEIKNNKLYYDKGTLTRNTSFERNKKVVNILEILLEKYTLTDTILLINTADGYFHDKDIPVFNWACPNGKQGLIFLNFNIFDFMINSRLETPVIMNYDEIKLLCKHYTPEHINNDMYFMGEDSSIRRTRIRENLSKENLPLNVRLNKTRDEKMFYI